jgi:hypothetical protein
MRVGGIGNKARIEQVYRPGYIYVVLLPDVVDLPVQLIIIQKNALKRL